MKAAERSVALLLLSSKLCGLLGSRREDKVLGSSGGERLSTDAAANAEDSAETSSRHSLWFSDFGSSPRPPKAGPGTPLHGRGKKHCDAIIRATPQCAGHKKYFFDKCGMLMDPDPSVTIAAPAECPTQAYRFRVALVSPPMSSALPAAGPHVSDRSSATPAGVSKQTTHRGEDATMVCCSEAGKSCCTYSYLFWIVTLIGCPALLATVFFSCHCLLSSIGGASSEDEDL
eukprot:TRINITY_DN4078_c0_g2_i1.p1 TRINITY_DN4078_c0_g2~~TRINITY_DN4078_c0_g2_i1.p1  ORF type:complete len:245 (-),score=35.41 TRINITY_DN4078_c0_g2_i1:139-828(-)